VRSKRNRNKCRREKDWDRRYRKFYGFVYRLQNNDLKDNEKVPLRYDLKYESWTLKDCYQPLQYISQEEIDAHFNNPETYESGSYRKPCIEAFVKCPFACPYRERSNYCWIIDRPGYYRVDIEPMYDEGGRIYRYKYKMHHYNGMPYFNYDNDRCYNNYVSRAYHQVLKHYSEIQRNIFKEKREIEYRKKCTYNRLKNAQIIKIVTARQKVRERASRVRGVTPTKETTAFFQALAIGSAIRSK